MSESPYLVPLSRPIRIDIAASSAELLLEALRGAFFEAKILERSAAESVSKGNDVACTVATIEMSPETERSEVREFLREWKPDESR